eukprot:4772071-Pleurochrysis_carterae.AAC.1
MPSPRTTLRVAATHSVAHLRVIAWGPRALRNAFPAGDSQSRRYSICRTLARTCFRTAQAV